MRSRVNIYVHDGEIVALEVATEFGDTEAAQLIEPTNGGVLIFDDGVSIVGETAFDVTIFLLTDVRG